jgi:hypothetical protein
MADLKELKKEADELGVQYPKNVTADKLTEKIDGFYDADATSGPLIQAAVAAQDVTEEVEVAKVTAPATDPKHAKRIAREKAARATHVVTIVDNDQRVNNHTTTCTVNCSNEFFDLGTMVLPLNEKIEVAVGHLKTLESVKIPLHVSDIKTGMSMVKLRPRYTIAYAG